MKHIPLALTGTLFVVGLGIPLISGDSAGSFEGERGRFAAYALVQAGQRSNSISRIVVPRLKVIDVHPLPQVPSNPKVDTGPCAYEPFSVEETYEAIVQLQTLFNIPIGSVAIRCWEPGGSIVLGEQ